MRFFPNPPPGMKDPTTPCWIYRSPRKDEMYLYLATADSFEQVPDVLLQRFGRPQLVMQLALTPARRLARVDASTVLAALREQGYFLQMPPQLRPELYHGNAD
jgi:uncharacterized protein YcgL (UPF0745 family)